MNHGGTVNELAAALAKAQGEMSAASKDKANPFFKSTYADLASVWEACRGPLSKNGLSVVQLPRFADGVVSVETVLLHGSGQWISTMLSAPVKENTAQAVGSATTYLRRYSLASMAGVAPDDDDANGASRPHDNSRTKAEEQQDEHDASQERCADLAKRMKAAKGVGEVAQLDIEATDFLRAKSITEAQRVWLAGVRDKCLEKIAGKS